jgi:hypothetical protein
MNMGNPISWRSLACTLVVGLMLFCPAWAAEKHSGTIVSIDKAASTIVVGEVAGRGKSGGARPRSRTARSA